MSHPVTLRIERAGLRLVGVVDLDQQTRAQLPEGADTLVLLGSTAGPFWTQFEAWCEAQPGTVPADPLDRFTRELVEPIAVELGATALYPFEGPPFWPFQHWAVQAEPVFVSPLKILIHPRLGLWHAYRAALIFGAGADLPSPTAIPGTQSPCVSCADQPCLTACPVGAYSQHGYDVQACGEHVASTHDCSEHGCGARQACPVGRAHEYARAQQQFHLRAFLHARRTDGQ